jgi:hypothetical protein
MACNAQGLCVAGNDIGDISSTVNPAGGVNAWHVLGRVLGPITAVACTLPDFCVVADNSGAVVTSTNPTGGMSSWQRATVDSQALTSISCASQSFCVAVDGAGNALVAQTSTASSNPPSNPTPNAPVAPRCLVPKVKGKSLSTARKAILAGNCALGAVKTPRKPRHKPPKHRRWKLVVGHESPSAGSTQPNGNRVSLTLVYKAIKK